MAAQRLQEQLDALVADVGYGATVEDLAGRAIAYSAQPTEVDEPRIQAILTRETPPDVYAWQQSHGIATATEPVRIPANPGLRMLPRLCVPLRHRGVRLGHLWIIESQQPCTPEQVAEAERRARGLAALLYRDRSPALAAWTAASATLGRALSGADRRTRTRALRRLADEHGVPDRAPLRVLVLHAAGADEARRAEALGQMHVALADRLGGRPRDRLAAIAGGHIAVLAVDDPTLGADDEAVAFAMRSRDEVEAAGAPAGRAAGVSDRHDGLAELAAAHDEAVGAARAAGVDPQIGWVAAWSQIGVYRLLLTGGLDGVDVAVAAPALARLDDVTLRHTLETYLDLGGNVQRTAAALHLHRTSLYHRLGRIEELAGVDLTAGPTRLELHVALKLARLAAAPAP
jgi:hypothetical protein